MVDLKAGAAGIRKTGFILLLLFCGSVFISKAAVNLFITLLLAVCLVYFSGWKRWDILKSRCLLVLALPMLLGLVASPFSDLGANGILAFLREYRAFLLIIPVTAFVSRNDEIETLLLVLNLSALASLVYSGVKMWPQIQTSHLFISLHTIGRSSDLLFSLILVNIVSIIRYKFSGRNTGFKFFLGVNTLFLFAGLLAMKIAAAWLGLVMGIIVVLFFCSKKALLLVCITGAFVPFYLPDFIKIEVKTALDIENSYSSKVRVQLNKTGFDYLIDRGRVITGTGADNAKTDYMRFMRQKPWEYRTKYKLAYRDHPGNFHNSFLQMAVEGGVLFVLAYLAGIFCVMVQMLRLKKRMTPNDETIIIAALSLVPVFFVSQLFHGGLFGYAGMVFSITLYSACVVMNRYW